jgi:hypothetical protein
MALAEFFEGLATGVGSLDDIARHFPDLFNGLQQDAHEFLVRLLGRLKQEAATGATAAAPSAKSRIQGNAQASAESLPLVDCVVGVGNSEVRRRRRRVRLTLSREHGNRRDDRRRRRQQ